MPRGTRFTRPAPASGSSASARFRWPSPKCRRKHLRFPGRAGTRRAYGEARSMAKSISPLVDTTTPLKAPTLRFGLLPKLTLLVIGLVVLSAIAVAVLLIRQQAIDEQGRLETAGTTIVAMLAERAGTTLLAGDTSSLGQMMQGLAMDRDIAYVIVLEAGKRPIYSHAFSAIQVPAMNAGQPQTGTITRALHEVEGHRYLELIAPIAPAPAPPGSALADPLPQGFIRLGMSFDRSQAQTRVNLVGVFSVVAAVMAIAVLLTLLMHRRLVAPMYQLMRAARSVSTGKLSLRVPAKSQDELGLLAHSFNHMIDRLSEAKTEEATYQRTL